MDTLQGLSICYSQDCVEYQVKNRPLPSLFCVSFWWQRWENIILSNSGQNWNEIENETVNSYRVFATERNTKRKYVKAACG